MRRRVMRIFDFGFSILDWAACGGVSARFAREGKGGVFFGQNEQNGRKFFLAAKRREKREALGIGKI
jgi:hypothetical protein